MTEFEFTDDRYKALRIQYPDVDTMCKGQCEGTGWYPENDQEDALWLEAQQKAPTSDGWHFVKCPDCDGTGKAK